LGLPNKEVASMATNSDFGRSSLLSEQYEREMELIAVALQEESLEEREDRTELVELSWGLTATCFQAENNDNEVVAPAHVALARQ
jgi:hypothetical protein